MTTLAVNNLAPNLMRAWLILLIGASSAPAQEWPALIDLSVAPGAESVDVWRVYGTEMFRLGMFNDGGGKEVAVGDIDGDGYDDLVFTFQRSRSSYWPYPRPRAELIACGGVYILYGNSGRPGQLTDFTLGQSADPDATRIVWSDCADDWQCDVFIQNGIEVTDFNGDGYADVALSTIASDLSFSGATVLYGGPNLRGQRIRLSESLAPHGMATIVRAPLDGPLTAEWGVSLESGDINADGFADLILVLEDGSNSTTGLPETACCYIVFGGDWEFAHLVTLIPNDPSPQSDVAYLRIRPSFDVNVTDVYAIPEVGDFNGDGFDDLAFGMPRSDPIPPLNDNTTPGYNTWPESYTRWTTTGAVDILYGNRSIPGTRIDLTELTEVHGGTRLLGETWHDAFGQELATGDLNGDGFDDLFVGAWTWLQNPSHEILYGVYGGTSPVGTPSGLGSVTDFYNSAGAFGEIRFVKTDLARFDGLLDYGVFHALRRTLDLGDFDADGLADIAVSDGIFPLGLSPAQGEVRIIRGTSQPLGTPLNNGSSVDFDAYPYPVRVLGNEYISENGAIEDSRLGSSVIAGGDFNGDGLEDLVIGAPYWQVTRESDNQAFQFAGAVFVLFGSTERENSRYVDHFAPGQTGLRGVGSSLAPVVRSWLAFNGGTKSAVEVTVNRSDASLGGLDHVATADVFWLATTDRTGWSSSKIRLQYTDAEIDGLSEYALRLYTAASGSGPWTEVAGQDFNYIANYVDATVPALGFFALLDERDKQAPRVQWITLMDANPTSAAEVRFKVKFSEEVLGVDEGDFALVAEGLVHSALLSVSGTGDEYVVTVRTGWGNGTLRIDVPGDAGVMDLAHNALTAAYTQGPHYTVNRPPVSVPEVASMLRMDPSPTSLDEVRYALTFTAPVTGVDLGDFFLNTDIPDATLLDVTGEGADYVVTVDTGTWTGNLRVDVHDDDSIVDSDEVPLGGIGVENGDYTGGEIYVIQHRDQDYEAPVVTGISRASVSPTSAVSVDFYVWFNESVDGVDATDFTLTTTGVTGAAITNVTGVDLVRIVTVSTGTGDGTIKLNLIDNDSIHDLAGNKLGTDGPHNGDYLNGHIYTIYKSDPGALPPVVSSITRLDTNPTDAMSVRFRVDFNEPVIGVDVDDFTLHTQGLTGSSIASITGVAATRTVEVNTGNGAGTLRLDVTDNDTIRDAADNPLGGIGADNGGFTSGEAYDIEREQGLDVRNFNRGEDVVAGTKYKVRWTSGAIGKTVRIELWRSGKRAATLDNGTPNDGVQTVQIPRTATKGTGYCIRIVSKNNPQLYSETKRFAIK